MGHQSKVLQRVLHSNDEKRRILPPATKKLVAIFSQQKTP
jgi:hypothetical protein